MSKQVLVVIPVEERHKEYLENKGTGCVFTYTSPKAVTEEELANAQIIIGNVSAEQLAKAPKLEWFQLNSAGSDAFCKPGVLKEGVLLTNATGAYGLAISEHMLGVTLMMQKHLAEYYVNQKNHQWKDEGAVTSIYGSTTLVVGLGDIGGEYAKRMKALGSYTIGLRRTEGEKPDYLDEQHIEWLKRYLQEYENAFILISHDIPFLNDVVNIIYHMENQRLDRYVGDYDKFQEVYEVKKSQLEAAYRKQQQEISELKDFVARNKARVATRNMAMSRQKKLDKMDVIELAAERPKPEFNFKLGRTPGRYIFETKDLVIGYDEPLSKPLNISMERGHKIALVGANGIGKTTLLKSILGLIPSLGGSVELGENLEIGYFEQEIKGENRNTCIDEIWEEFPSFSQYEVRSALAKCGLTTKHIESLVRVLSGGEQAKVRLCKLINKSTNVLLLDEPTNHLDVDAKDELKRALQEYRGSILLICHEPEFYQDIVNEVWDCSKWTTKIL